MVSKNYYKSMTNFLYQELAWGPIFKKKDGSKRRPFNLELYKFNLVNRSYLLIYGEPKNTPFSSVSTLDKMKMGEITLKYLKENNLT